MNTTPLLLSVIESGGYAYLFPVYRELGFRVEVLPSVRKAQVWLKRNDPVVMVAEFSCDPSFRDRMSNLESLLASLQKEKLDTRVIVLIEKDFLPRLEAVSQRYSIQQVLTYPIDTTQMQDCLSKILDDQ